MKCFDILCGAYHVTFRRDLLMLFMFRLYPNTIALTSLLAYIWYGNDYKQSTIGSIVQMIFVYFEGQINGYHSYLPEKHIVWFVTYICVLYITVRDSKKFKRIPIREDQWRIWQLRECLISLCGRYMILLVSGIDGMIFNIVYIIYSIYELNK